MPNSWTIADLNDELTRFEAELAKLDLPRNLSVPTWVDRGALFAGLLVNSCSKARASSQRVPLG
jgi:hypothetical protein